MVGPGSSNCHIAQSNGQHRWPVCDLALTQVPFSSKTCEAATAMALKLEVFQTVTLGHRHVVASLRPLAQVQGFL